MHGCRDVIFEMQSVVVWTRSTIIHHNLMVIKQRVMRFLMKRSFFFGSMHITGNMKVDCKLIVISLYHFLFEWYNYTKEEVFLWH